MAKELNDAFRRKPNGLTNFLHRRPLLVEIQYVVTGTIANPMTGTNTTVRTPLAEVLQTTRKVGTSGDVGVLAAHVMYCDFERYDVINNAQGTPRSRPRLVVPTIKFTPGISKVPMYYLPWKEDKRFTMSLGDKADYFYDRRHARLQVRGEPRRRLRQDDRLAHQRAAHGAGPRPGQCLRAGPCA